MNKIKELRKEKRISQEQLAKLLNTTQTTISGWEKDKWQPDNEAILKMCNIFSCSADYLLDRNNIKNDRRIPVLGRIPAGIPINMIEDILDYEDISPDMLSGGKEYFALKVKGDSMSPKFLDGDVVIVRKQDDCENGAFAIVAVNGYDATFKKIIKKENGLILQPLNANYEPQVYTNEDITALPIRVLGIVVEIRRSV